MSFPQPIYPCYVAGAAYPSPAHQWKLNEGTGTTVGDTGTVGGMTGSFSGSPAWSATGPILSECLLFHGNPDQIDFSSSPIADYGADGSITAWVNFVSAVPTGQSLYGVYIDSSTVLWLRPNSGANLYSVGWANTFNQSNTGTVSGLTTGTWYLYTMTKASGVVNVYLNNNASSIATYTPGTGSGTASSFSIAGLSGLSGYGINAYMSDVRIYTTVITSANIAAIYAGTA